MSSRSVQFFLVIPTILIGLLLTRSPYMMASTAPSTQWADGPMKLITTPQFQTKKNDMFSSGATHMCLVHNCILRGYNSIWHQAPHVQEADKADFIGYSRTWFKFVKSHHDDEEAGLFPQVAKLLGDEKLWAEAHQEHESFLAELGEFDKYLSSLASPAAFSAVELRRIMAVFQAKFEEHFHNEIGTIAAMADHPKAPKPGSDEEAAAALAFKSWGKNTVTKAGMADVVPFFLLNLDRTVEDGMWAHWPPMPGPIKWIMVNVVGAIHSGWWKFSSCDGNQQPKELYALQFPEVES